MNILCPNQCNDRKRKQEPNDEPNKRLKSVYDTTSPNRNHILARSKSPRARKVMGRPSLSLVQEKRICMQNDRTDNNGGGRTPSMPIENSSKQTRCLPIEEEIIPSKVQSASLEAELKIWQQRHATLQANNVSAEAKIAVLTSDNASMRAEFNSLLAQVALLQEENSRLRERDLSMQRSYSLIQKEKARSHARILSLETENNSLKAENATLQARNLEKPMKSSVLAKEKLIQSDNRSVPMDNFPKNHLEDSLDGVKENGWVPQTKSAKGPGLPSVTPIAPSTTNTVPMPRAPVPNLKNGISSQQTVSKDLDWGAKQEIVPLNPGTLNEHPEEGQNFNGFLIEDNLNPSIRYSETGNWEEFFDWDAADLDPSIFDIQTPKN